MIPFASGMPIPSPRVAKESTRDMQKIASPVQQPMNFSAIMPINTKIAQDAPSIAVVEEDMLEAEQLPLPLELVL